MIFLFFVSTSGGIDRVIRQWDADSGACVREYVGHDAAVTNLVTGQRWLVSAAQDGQVRLWDPRVADSRKSCVQQFAMREAGPIRALRYVNDSTVLTVSSDSVVRLWDSVGARLRQKWDATRYGPLLDLIVDSTFEQAFLVPQQPDTGVVSPHAASGIALLPVPDVHKGILLLTLLFVFCKYCSLMFAVSNNTHTGHELTAAARDATKLVTTSGTDGGLAMFAGVRNQPASEWKSVALTSTNPADEMSEPGASLCLSLVDTLLATGHQSGGIRLFIPNNVDDGGGD